MSGKKITDDSFLHQSGLTGHIQEVLRLVLLNRPDDPIAYISAHLDEVVNGVSPVTKAFRRLKLVGKSDKLDQRFVDMLWPIYQSLSTERKPSGKHGVVGSDFMQLLGMLCSDLSPQASDTLQAKFESRSHAHVPFQFFAAGVLTCTLYNEFIRRAEQVYTMLPTKGELASKTACEALLRALGNSAWRAPVTTLFPPPAAVPAAARTDADSIRKVLAAGRAVEGSDSDIGVPLPDFLQSASRLFMLLLCT